MYKTIFRIAFLFATGICMTACSSGDDDIADKTTPVAPGTKDNVVTLIGTIRAGGETTRALDTNGKTVFWKVGDEIWVEYEMGTGYSSAKGVITDVQSDTHDATFRATLINPKSNSRIGLAYPYDKVSAVASTTNFAFTFDYTGLANQKGTTAYISDAKLDYASSTTDVTLNTSTNPATLNSVITLQNQVCICQFNVKDGGSPLNARMLEITLGTNTTPDYTIVPDDDLSTFYVALPETSGKVTIEASTCGDNGAMKLDREAKLNAMKSTDVGKYISVDASDGNQAYLCTNLTSSSQSTAKICKHTYSSATLAKGKLYSQDLSTTEKNLTPRAVVASVGSVSNYWNKFLALALEDATSAAGNVTGSQSTVTTWVTNHATKIAGTNYNSVASRGSNQSYDEVTSGITTSNQTSASLIQGWRIPTVTDWRYIFDSLCNGRSATSPVGVVDNGPYYDGSTKPEYYTTIDTKCGNTIMQDHSTSCVYWSGSSAENQTKVWRYNFVHDYFMWVEPTDNSFVRMVIAY